MSDPKKVKLHTIPAEAIVNLKCSGFFHKRLAAVYFNFVSKIETTTFEKIVQHMNKHELEKLTPDERKDAVCLETLLILISSLEKQFTDKGLEVEQEFEVPSED